MNWRVIAKNLTYFLIFAGIIGGAIWLVYFFFGENPTLQNITSSIFQTPPAAEESVPSVKNLTTLTADPIFDYWLNKQTNTVYYLNLAGQIFEISNNSGVMANSQPLASLNKILPSNDGTYMVARFNYPGQPLFSIFNTVTKSWQPLPATTIAAAWSPNSNDIAYIDNQGLKTLNLTTKKTQSIVSLSQKDLDVRWRTDNKILLSSTMGDSTKIMALDLKTKNITPFLEEFGLALNWDSTDNYGLKLSRTNNESRLNFIDKNGSLLFTAAFLTMPSKCAIQSARGVKVYCAVPKNIPDGMKLPEDYHQQAIYFDDILYSIDLGTASVSEIPTGSTEPIDAEHLEISGGKLLFKNRLDDKLYSLTL